MKHIPVRLVLAVGTRQPNSASELPVTWDRIDSDTASRALFLAALDAAIDQRIAERAAEVAELDMFVAFAEAAAATAKGVVHSPTGERAA
ncbi:hypothetical protein [Streptomyces laculatispora]|uniref:hypothetical protein n=1 Tax=Streptomyces laculatispora TaxID=887464 RepID=UPI001A948644|nr:hypothetical protein [Streptomyces laculatispora]MBO0918699.1 hypothetical protein [Streptomyces laculatispora]